MRWINWRPDPTWFKEELGVTEIELLCDRVKAWKKMPKHMRRKDPYTTELEQFTGKIQKDDRIYFFSSPEHSWITLAGRAGYALVRNGEVIDYLITTLS